jgi:hypothetical protein
VIEFQDASGRMLERSGDHAVMMVSQDGCATEPLHSGRNIGKIVLP